MSLGLARDGPVRKPLARAIWRGDPVSGSIVTRPCTPRDFFMAKTAVAGLAASWAARDCRTSPARPSRRESKCPR